MLIQRLTRSQRAKQPNSAQPTGLPFQELAALRMAGSTSRFKPAEEQFIEQTPWANPQHPSHAHLIQRQTSAQQVPRTTSPFAQATPRRHSDQHGPTSGTFSNPPVNGPPFSSQPPGALSPRRQSAAPSLPDNKQTSLSPVIVRSKADDAAKVNGAAHSSPPPGASVGDKHREFPQEARREQAPTTMGRF
jgi:hypothetical protein